MNVYRLVKCECGKVFELEDSVMVHGAMNYNIAISLLEKNPMSRVKEMFCKNCGSYKESFANGNLRKEKNKVCCDNPD